MTNQPVTDSSLAERLGTDREGIVLNPAFLPWQELIEQQILTSSNPMGDEYTKCKEAKILYEEVLTHAADYACEELPDRGILVVHPFFLALDEFHVVSGNPIEHQHMTFMDKLFFVFAHAKQAGYGLVLFDTAQHYAAASSLLSEKRVFDRVVITASNQGYVPKEDVADELSFLRGMKPDMIGMYNGLCLSDVCTAILNNWLCIPKEMRAIGDMIIDPPSTLGYDPEKKAMVSGPVQSLFPERIIRRNYGDHRGAYQLFEPAQVISSQDIFGDRILSAGKGIVPKSKI